MIMMDASFYPGRSKRYRKPEQCRNVCCCIVQHRQELMNIQGCTLHSPAVALGQPSLPNPQETTPEGEDVIKIGKLNLVDLAGSENISRYTAQCSPMKCIPCTIPAL
jgi:hypothetical protein